MNNMQLLFVITFLVFSIEGINSLPSNKFLPSKIRKRSRNPSLINPTDSKLSEDGRLNFTGLANKYGFECEEHQVITEDGYILTNFHIPGDVNKVVLLAHGGTPTSDCWIIRGQQSLAIKLAKQKYDVWAINFRGTRYSRSHVFLDADKDMIRFFNFTLLEQGIHDLPAVIDYVLKKTGQKKVTAISHSLGTTSFFILGAERPNYNDKIQLHVPLAPMTNFKHLRGIIFVLTSIIKKLIVAGIIPVYEDGGTEIFAESIRHFLQAICINTIISDICVLFIYLFTGYDPGSIEAEFLGTLFGHFPGGTSTKVYKMIGQNFMTENFTKFDYGVKRNLEVYHSPEPPKIDLTKVTMKTAMVVGAEDIVATIKDSQLIRNSLPNVVCFLILPYPKFSHLDFIYARNMETHLFPHIFDILDKYEKTP